MTITEFKHANRIYQRLYCEEDTFGNCTDVMFMQGGTTGDVIRIQTNMKSKITTP